MGKYDRKNIKFHFRDNKASGYKTRPDGSFCGLDIDQIEKLKVGSIVKTYWDDYRIDEILFMNQGKTVVFNVTRIKTADKPRQKFINTMIYE